MSAYMPDKHYPIGFVFGAREIAENYSEEARALGTITILWNRLELRLKSLFELILGEQRQFAGALWDGQNTHRGRMKLMALALDTVDLTENRRVLLAEIIARVEALSKRRNTLTHGEFVVDVTRDELLARTHRGKKAPLYAPSDFDALNDVIRGLEEADDFIATLSLDYVPIDLLDNMKALAAELRAERRIS